MDQHAARMHNALKRIDDFLTSVPEFAPLIGTTAYGALKSTMEELDSLIATQNQRTRDSKGATKTMRAAVVVLRRQMRTVAAAARLRLREEPDFVKLQMPRGKPSLDQLLASAAGMAASAEHHQEVLKAAGLPNDFVAKLNAAHQAVESSRAEQAIHSSIRTGATASLRTVSRDVTHVIRMLDGLAVPLIPAGDSGGLLARWNVAKHVAGRPRPSGEGTSSQPKAA